MGGVVFVKIFFNAYCARAPSCSVMSQNAIGQSYQIHHEGLIAIHVFTCICFVAHTTPHLEPERVIHFVYKYFQFCVCKHMWSV